jgi:hypothetical protein
MSMVPTARFAPALEQGLVASGSLFLQFGSRKLLSERTLTLLLLPLLLVLALSCPAACRANDAAPVALDQAAPDAVPAGSGIEPDPSTANAPRVRVPRPRVHRTAGQGIEQTVHRMAAGLGLDTAQQDRLRQILWDEQKVIRRLRDNPGPGIDWPAATASIVSQTKARIRSLLTDEQKSKYSVDVPREGLAPAQANLQHYMQIEESKRQQDEGASR